MSARSILRKAVKWNLQQITTGASYAVTLGTISDPPIAIEKIISTPHVNILWGREDRLNNDIVGNEQYLDLSIRCVFDVFLQEINDFVQAQDNAIAAIQKRFGRYFYIPSSSGDRTVFNCLYVGSQPFGVESNIPLCGVSIDYDIWYKIRIDNPDFLT